MLKISGKNKHVRAIILDMVTIEEEKVSDVVNILDEHPVFKRKLQMLYGVHITTRRGDPGNGRGNISGRYLEP